jgi:3-phosphoshikimate 1-carboxyvinyltransferase
LYEASHPNTVCLAKLQENNSVSAIASRKCQNLKGQIVVPGDKSISHRALMLGGIAVGETIIHGLLEGEDVLCTAAAMESMGAQIERPSSPGEPWRVYGRGVGGLSEPSHTLDMGNSGTAARLMTGLVAAHPFNTVFSGDESLNSRPMARVTAPLEQMGASFVTREGGRMPMSVLGSDQLIPIEYELPVASAQVKSAILLAGLNTAGITTVIESHATRDHSERMLQHFGATVETVVTDDGGRRIAITGHPELTGQQVIVPSDISSAAFPIVAALITPGSEITIDGVGMNPLRTGILDTLVEMGAQIEFLNERDEAGEPVADLMVKSSSLKGVVVPPDRAPSMIDEYPVLAMAAACASGETRMEGIGELRVKESDRLGVVARGLKAAGVDLEEGDDWLVIHGTGKPPAGGNVVAAELDHRIAMSFLVLGMVTDKPVTIDDGSPMNTSFPGFADLMNGLGTNLAWKNNVR